MNSIQAAMWELRKFLFPRSAVRVLRGRIHQDESDDALRDSSIILELYQRLGEVRLARQEYERIRLALLVTDAVAGAQLTRSSSYVLARLAFYERHVLGNDPLAAATARRALATARIHRVSPVMELLRNDFPELFEAPPKPKAS